MRDSIASSVPVPALPKETKSTNLSAAVADVVSRADAKSPLKKLGLAWAEVKEFVPSNFKLPVLSVQPAPVEHHVEAVEEDEQTMEAAREDESKDELCLWVGGLFDVPVSEEDIVQFFGGDYSGVCPNVQYIMCIDHGDQVAV
jgi:hypothetical protein